MSSMGSWVVRLLASVPLVLALTASALAQPAGATEVEAWFYLGRQNDAGAWAPASSAFRFDRAQVPKQVTVLRDAVLVDNINPDPSLAGGNTEAAKWVRVARRGPAAIPVLELVRQDSIGQGKLVWGRVRVPDERVAVVSRN